MTDSIVDEVHRIRDEYAARFNYDLDAIYQDLKEREKKSGRKYVSFVPPRIEQGDLRPEEAPIEVRSRCGPKPVV